MNDEKEIHPVDKAIANLGGLLDTDIPSAVSIWQRAQHFLSVGDTASAKRCQRLNYLLHNSSVPNGLKLGRGVRFAYGGIGLVLHVDCEIRMQATLGSNVTLGGRAGQFRTDAEGRRLYVPLIDAYACIATGSSVLGGVTVGKMAVVGANSVVLQDIPPLSVAVGQPAKVVAQITPENALQYKGSFTTMRAVSNDDYVALVRQIAAEAGN